MKGGRTMDVPRLKIGFDVEINMPVYIDERYIHILLMGKSGEGKSVTIANWWEHDNYYGNAKVLVDPSGFLARDCYSISRGKKVNVDGLTYCSMEHPISINPMKAPYTESQISDIIAETINQVVSVTTANQQFTVKMRGILDEAIKYCLRNNRKSLLNVLDYIKNMQGDKETRDGIIARLSFVLSDERMVKILCGNDAVEWGQLIRNRQTFILDCSSMSKEKMVFVGTLVAHGISAYFRYARPKIYNPLSLYIDECHNFVNPYIFDILKEGRKYKLSCCLSTQDFAVIDDRMTRVMLNAGNIVSYRLGHREASYVAKELAMAPEDIQFIEKYHAVYLTPKGKGIAKAPRPPFFKEVKPPKMVEPQRKAMKPSWFTMDTSGSYQQPDPTI
jgi:hypothetical protein